jgi:hypothetical protein
MSSCSSGTKIPLRHFYIRPLEEGKKNLELGFKNNGHVIAMIKSNQFPSYDLDIHLF